MSGMIVAPQPTAVEEGAKVVLPDINADSGRPDERHSIATSTDTE